jgi:hypothetical protein
VRTGAWGRARAEGLVRRGASPHSQELPMTPDRVGLCAWREPPSAVPGGGFVATPMGSAIWLPLCLENGPSVLSESRWRRRNEGGVSTRGDLAAPSTDLAVLLLPSSRMRQGLKLNALAVHDRQESRAQGADRRRFGPGAEGIRTSLSASPPRYYAAEHFPRDTCRTPL